MTTDSSTVAPPDEHQDSHDPPEITDAPALTSLGAAASLIFGGIVMLGFGAAWAYLFYPPTSLAAAGVAVALAFAIPAFGASIREFVNVAHLRGRRVM